MENFGIREVCELAFKAKIDQTIGGRKYKAGETVIRFDTAKTSGLEGAATTVYAQGGRGNPRLIAWNGEKTLTLTFEEALMSLESMQLLMGATINSGATYNHHFRARVKAEDTTKLDVSSVLKEAVYGGSETTPNALVATDDFPLYVYDDETGTAVEATKGTNAGEITATVVKDKIYVVDGYMTVTGKTLSIEPDVFGKSYYIEAETLVRDQETAEDKACQITIPNGNIQSNYTITMANSGDPSTFTFTVDCMSDYTKADKTKKVLADLSIIE